MMGHDELKAYLDRARRWEQDLLLSAHRSKRLAWIVAAVASILATASVSALAALTPLKTVEPFVVRVDNATGIVDVVSALDEAPSTYNEAVTKYFLAKYVRAREGFGQSEAEENFRTVSLLSTRAEQERWSTYFRGSNPESPQIVYGRNGGAEVSIKAISLLSDKLVSVRFLKQVRLGDETSVSHWIATVAFNYHPEAPISTSDRLVNPLGFLVSEYRADPEVVP